MERKGSLLIAEFSQIEWCTEHYSQSLQTGLLHSEHLPYNKNYRVVFFLEDFLRAFFSTSSMASTDILYECPSSLQRVFFL
jgi:hypothetical protein